MILPRREPSGPEAVLGSWRAVTPSGRRVNVSEDEGGDGDEVVLEVVAVLLVRLEKVVMSPLGRVAMAGIMEVVRVSVDMDVVGREIGMNASAMWTSVVLRGQTVAIGIPRVTVGKEVLKMLEIDIGIVGDDIAEVLMIEDDIFRLRKISKDDSARRCPKDLK